MIVAPIEGDQLLVITQNDHAHFAAELLALWRTDGLPEHPRRRSLLFAAREHDNGWAETDSAPMCRPGQGRPADFMTVTRDVRWDIWRRGTCRHVDRDPYGALLIVRHAIHLHRSQRRDAEWSEVFAEWHELEAELAEAAGIAEADLEQDYRWIELTDLLSLAVCNRWTHEVERHGFRGTFEGATGTLALEPFPLAGTTTFQVACRSIPDRRYAGDTDLGVELATARWQQHTIRVRP